jgi:hypothetical protein
MTVPTLANRPSRTHVSRTKPSEKETMFLFRDLRLNSDVNSGSPPDHPPVEEGAIKSVSQIAAICSRVLPMSGRAMIQRGKRIVRCDDTVHMRHLSCQSCFSLLQRPFPSPHQPAHPVDHDFREPGAMQPALQLAQRPARKWCQSLRGRPCTCPWHRLKTIPSPNFEPFENDVGLDRLR